MVIWITGLSGAGKSTICNALHEILKADLPELVILDGDVVRAAFGHNLGYIEEDRIKQAHRLQSLARVLSDQGLIVIVGVLYNNEELLAWNRAELDDYFEVYLKASLDTVQSRDPKGLYAKRKSGELSDVVGIDIPWHEPENSDLILDMDEPSRPNAMALQIVESIPRLHAAMKLKC
jgi:adenylyl-sulfate kinase